MANLEVTDQKGKPVGNVNLNEETLDVEPNKSAVFDAIIRRRAGKCQGTSAVKNRSAVRSGGKKLWKQRGAGHAHQGSIGTSQWRGGSTVFGPTPRPYKMDMPREARRSAMESVPPQEVTDKDLIILDQLTLEAPKTKELKAILGNVNVSGRVLAVSDDKNVQLSGKNPSKVKVIPVNGLSVADAVNCQKLVLTQDTTRRIEGVLA